MNQEQLNAITGLLAGMETSIVHLANVVGRHCNLNPEELAASFEATGEAIPQEIPNRPLLQVSLKHIAAGIRGSASGPHWDELMERLRQH